MALEGVLQSYKRSAEVIEWKKYNSNELIREYINHENDELADNYFAGIVCRYWGLAGRIYTQCNFHIPFEECHDCIIDAIRYVLKNRVWENPDSSLYGDKTGPDKAVHVAIKRQKSIMLSKYTAFRRQSNFNTLSIDSAHEDYKDSADGLLFDFATSEGDRSLNYLISSYFADKDYLKGLILDTICFSNCGLEVSSIVKYLRLLDKKYYNYYKDNYGADEKIYKKTLRYIYDTSNKLLEVKINQLLHALRQEAEHDRQQ